MKGPSFTFSRRSSGVLLHPTSLPGHHGNGDLGPAALRFADFLHAAGQTWWQMLPVNPPGEAPGFGPYGSTSAFAGSPFLISLDLLAQDGLLQKRDLIPEGELNGDAVAQLQLSFTFRMRRLRKAFEFFDRTGAERAAFHKFCRVHKSWLDDYALYSALRDAHGGSPWYTWPAPLRLREASALREARKSLSREIRFQQFLQYEFDKQWHSLRSYCHARGIGLIGDIPIFVAHDSADVWVHRDLFLLESSGYPQTVSGYPPDDFNALGQRWDHPHYDWKNHKKEEFAWWIERFKQTLRLFDGVRIDHFLGFHRAWHIPTAAKNARRGKWVLSPGRELFDRLMREIPDAKEKIIAEDLGKLTPQASALRDRYNFPGMRVMQFGFGKDGRYHLPHTFPRRCVAYTGTHDNNTIVGWLDELRTTMAIKKHRPRALEFAKAMRYLNNTTGVDVHWDFIRSLIASCADTVIFPMQDMLGLDVNFRMNVPGTVEGNWRWRLRDGQLRDEHAAKLREMVELFDRMPMVRVLEKPTLSRRVRQTSPQPSP